MKEETKEKEEPKQENPDRRTKQNSTTILVHENGKYQFKKFTRFYEFDLILRKWIKKEEKVTYESLESHGLTKDPIRIDAIFIQERPSETLMTSTEISFFLGTFKFEIPQIKEFEHAYLSFSEEEKSVSMNVLRPNYSYVIDFNDKSFCELVEQPRRISREEAQRLMTEKKVYPHFLKMHAGVIAVVSHLTTARP